MRGPISAPERAHHEFQIQQRFVVTDEIFAHEFWSFPFQVQEASRWFGIPRSPGLEPKPSEAFQEGQSWAGADVMPGFGWRWAAHMFNRGMKPLFLLGCLGAGALAGAHAAEPRPNFLWIIAEDMSPHFSMYGVPEVRTPNIDALARRGMRFDRAFVTGPVCSTSRSAFNTGMYQTTLGAHHQRSHRPDEPGYKPHPLPQGVRVLADWMRDLGYLTGDLVHLPPAVGFKASAHTDWNFTYAGKHADTDRWDDLKARPPFYAQLNLPEAHRGRAWDEAAGKLAVRADPAKVALPPYYPDHPVVREDWANYLNCVMVADAKVGSILEQLERDGLAASTVVVFMSDHGQAMVRAKQWLYDSGIRIPMIVYWPSAIPAPAGYRAGSVSQELVTALDLAATTLALGGGRKPEKMQGRVLFGPQREPEPKYVFGARDRCDETVDRIRTVRSRQYRYLRNYYPERPFLQTNRYKETNYPTMWVLRELHAAGKLAGPALRLVAPTRPGEELYDMMADPHEIVNLTDSPQHAAVLKEMRAALDEWIVATDDQGRFPEDPAVIAHYERMMQRNYDAKLEQQKAQRKK
jgi:N-sulfoglucosamine sulfohydrolase